MNTDLGRDGAADDRYPGTCKDKRRAWLSVPGRSHPAEAQTLTPCSGLKSKEKAQRMQDGMKYALNTDYNIHFFFFLHMASSEKFSGKKLPSIIFYVKLQPSQHFWLLESPLFFSNQRVLCSSPNNLGLVLIFHLGCLKCSQETVLPFRNSKYIHEPLLFFKVTGIFLGNYLNLRRIFAFHVSSCF